MNGLLLAMKLSSEKVGYRLGVSLAERLKGSMAPLSGAARMVGAAVIAGLAANCVDLRLDLALAGVQGEVLEVQGFLDMLLPGALPVAYMGILFYLIRKRVIKCWPEMGNLHTTPCAVLGRLADEGILIGCEGDVDAELTQMVQYYITGLPTFITDMIHIDEERNIMAFWHCGNGAPSLANPKYELLLRNHPLAGQGTAFWGALKPGKVTIARFCNLGGQYKLFLMRGKP